MTPHELKIAVYNAAQLYIVNLPGPAAPDRNDYMRGLYDGAVECYEHVKWFLGKRTVHDGWGIALTLELRDLSKRFKVDDDHSRGLLDGYELVCRAIARDTGLTL